MLSRARPTEIAAGAGPDPLSADEEAAGGAASWFAVDPPAGRDAVLLRRTRSMADLVPETERRPYKRGAIVRGRVEGDWLRLSNGLWLPKHWLRQVDPARLRKRARDGGPAPAAAAARSPRGANAAGTPAPAPAAPAPRKSVEEDNPITECVRAAPIVVRTLDGDPCNGVHLLQLPRPRGGPLVQGSQVVLYETEERRKGRMTANWGHKDASESRVSTIRHCDLRLQTNCGPDICGQFDCTRLDQGQVQRMLLTTAPAADSGLPACPCADPSCPRRTGPDSVMVMRPVVRSYRVAPTPEKPPGDLSAEEIERALRRQRHGRGHDRKVRSLAELSAALDRRQRDAFLKAARAARCGDAMSEAEFTAVWQELRGQPPPQQAVLALFAERQRVAVAEILDLLCPAAGPRRRRPAADDGEEDEDLVEGDAELRAFDDDLDDQFVVADKEGGTEMDSETRAWRTHEDAAPQKVPPPASPAGSMEGEEGELAAAYGMEGPARPNRPAAAFQRIARLNTEAEGIGAVREEFFGDLDDEDADSEGLSSTVAPSSTPASPVPASPAVSAAAAWPSEAAAARKAAPQAGAQKPKGKQRKQAVTTVAAAAAAAAAGAQPQQQQQQGRKRKAAAAAAAGAESMPPPTRRIRQQPPAAAGAAAAAPGLVHPVPGAEINKAVKRVLDGGERLALGDFQRKVATGVPQYAPMRETAKQLERSGGVPERDTIRTWVESVKAQVSARLGQLGCDLSKEHVAPP